MGWEGERGMLSLRGVGWENGWVVRRRRTRRMMMAVIDR